MTDWFDEFDDEPRTQDEKDPEPEDDGGVGGLSLDDLIASEDEFVRKFAEGLKQLREAKAEREAREAEALEAQAALDAGGAESLDETELVALAEAQRRGANDIFRKNMTLALRAQGFSDDSVRERMVEEEAAMEAVEAWEGPAQPSDLAAFREMEVNKAQAARGRQTALEMSLRDRTIEDDRREAEEGVAEAVAKVLAS